MVPGPGMIVSPSSQYSVTLLAAASARTARKAVMFPCTSESTPIRTGQWYQAGELPGCFRLVSCSKLAWLVTGQGLWSSGCVRHTAHGFPPGIQRPSAPNPHGFVFDNLSCSDHTPTRVSSVVVRSSHFGLWRSLVAHLTGGQGVASSNLVSPTIGMRLTPKIPLTRYFGNGGLADSLARRLICGH